jgi:hypothetical protein
MDGCRGENREELARGCPRRSVTYPLFGFIRAMLVLAFWIFVVMLVRSL